MRVRNIDSNKADDLEDSEHDFFTCFVNYS